jgi:predicted outer membrane repeat protein
MFAKKSISCISPVLFVVVLMLAVTPLQVAHGAGIRYAKPAASGTGDCLSWVNVCTLQTALTGAVSGDEIWVAGGTYKPTTVGTDRAATFQLIDGVALYGGFAGTETARDQRNPSVNVTILSGDIDNNDSQTPIITDLTTVDGNTTNSYHVVIGATGYDVASLDGFTITAGNANGDSDPNNRGGGMYNLNNSSRLTNVTFSGNSATYGGGGMFNQYSDSPTLTDVTFSDNSATYGGGMYNEASRPTLTNVTFSGNSATYGGGIYNGNYGTLISRNVTFSGNSATYGGGIYSYAVNGTTSELYSATFSGNSATSNGGGLYNDSSLSIRNTIFWSNTASAGAQIYSNPHNGGGGYIIPVNDSVVQDGCPERTNCTNIITTDPMLGTLGDYGGFTQTIPLLAGSSAIDTGYDALCPAADQRGVTRPQGTHCDIGAFELDTAPMVTSITRLNPSPTNLASVVFTVTFSESVTGVGVSDFSLTTTGVFVAAVSGFSGSGSVYTVTVNTGTGNGTIRLDVPASATVTDLAGNPLAGLPYTGGETYTVEKNYWNYLPLIIR